VNGSKGSIEGEMKKQKRCENLQAVYRFPVYEF
jgi:hypothetical protein